MLRELLLAMPKSTSVIPTVPPGKILRRGGCELSYFVVGPEDGRPLVLCHGLAASGLQFVADAEFFSARGFKVLVPDLRGHGRSRCSKTLANADYSIAAMAADLIAMLDAENIAVADWVGNSLGGIIALFLMGTDRVRLGRFVSFGTAYTLDVAPLIASALQLSYALVPRQMLARLGALTTCKDQKPRALIHAMLSNMNLNAISHVTHHVRQYDYLANGMAFDGPILMIKGGRDRAVNLALPTTLSAMGHRSNFHLIEMREAGHCANLDQPDKVRSAILDFLD